MAYLANVWNIGAEGQLTAGAIFAGFVPVMLPEWQSPLTLMAMMAIGVIGGMAWGPFPPFLRNRFHANEILDITDAGLCDAAVSRLAGAWAMAGSARLQLSQDHHLLRLAIVALSAPRAFIWVW